MTEDALKASKGRKKVLVVDDDPDIVNLIRYQLQLEGYQVIPAYDGLEALARVAEQGPDLIVLDIMMPKVDGWVVCHSVKSNRATGHTKVIILSAKTQIHARLKGLYILQADMYMTKPFDFEELSGNISRLLHIGEDRLPSGEAIQPA
jgi:two-component system alkaline phosphatase synthesis response regulator PhoP